MHALAATIPERYHAMVVLAAGTGLRQGEIFGLTIDRVDFLRRTLTVDRQLVGVRGQAPTFAPPKTAASTRTIPLRDVVLEALAMHVRRFPPGPHGVVFTGSDGQLLRRSAFGNLWRRVNTEAGVEGRTFHSLRHYYASLLIRHGESAKAGQARLGHASVAETLDTALPPVARLRRQDAPSGRRVPGFTVAGLRRNPGHVAGPVIVPGAWPTTSADADQPMALG